MENLLGCIAAVRSTAQQKLTHFLRLSDVGTIAMTTPDLLL